MVAFEIGGLAQQSSRPESSLPVADFTVEVLGSKVAEFSEKMDAYRALRESLEIGLPALVRARAGARRGAIFTEETRRAFRQLLRPVINAATCAAIRDENPGEFEYAINATYPKEMPLSTVPPSILAALPRLPDDVWYRFLDRDLILHDTRANIILDRIDNAIRCRD